MTGDRSYHTCRSMDSATFLYRTHWPEGASSGSNLPSAQLSPGTACCRIYSMTPSLRTQTVFGSTRRLNISKGIPPCLFTLDVQPGIAHAPSSRDVLSLGN